MYFHKDVYSEIGSLAAFAQLIEMLTSTLSKQQKVIVLAIQSGCLTLQET